MRRASRPILALATVALALLPAAGCASYFLKGADEAESAPRNVRASYVAPTCTLDDGQAADGPEAVYHLTDTDPPLLFEIEPSGDGSRITNRWTDAVGTHFFVWKGNGPGYHFVFPADDRPPVRYVFSAGSYELDASTEGVTRPIGRPSAACVMQRRSAR